MIKKGNLAYYCVISKARNSPDAPIRLRYTKVAITIPVVVRPRPIWQLKTISVSKLA